MKVDKSETGKAGVNKVRVMEEHLCAAYNSHKYGVDSINKMVGTIMEISEKSVQKHN